MNRDTVSVRPWGRNTIVRSWRGQEPLWLVFWVYHVLVGVLLNLAFGWLIHRRLAFALLALCIFWFVYVVWVLVSIWRCAANSLAIWCFLARLIVILSIVWCVVRLVHEFA